MTKFITSGYHAALQQIKVAEFSLTLTMTFMTENLHRYKTYYSSCFPLKNVFSKWTLELGRTTYLHLTTTQLLRTEKILEPQDLENLQQHLTNLHSRDASMKIKFNKILFHLICWVLHDKKNQILRLKYYVFFLSLHI